MGFDTARARAGRAAAVSRLLRTEVTRPLPSGTPRTREGVRVTGSVLGRVSVSFDYDDDHPSYHRVVDAARDALTAAGYTIEESPATPADGLHYPRFYVTKEGA